MPRRLPLLPGRHPLPGAGGWRSAARCGLLPGSVHGAGPCWHGGGLPLQEEQGEEEGGTSFTHQDHQVCRFATGGVEFPGEEDLKEWSHYTD